MWLNTARPLLASETFASETQFQMEQLRLSHLLERDAVAFGSESQLHLLASLIAPEGPDETEDTKRSPVDLVAVLDRCFCHACIYASLAFLARC